MNTCRQTHDGTTPFAFHMMNSTRGILAFVLVGALTLGACSDVAPTSGPETAPAPAVSSGSGSSDNYIVILKESDNTLGKASSLARVHGLKVGQVYQSAIKGFSATIDEMKVEALRRDPSVAIVEAVQPVTINQTATYQAIPWGINQIDADVSSTLAGNRTGTVTGVRVYIVDSGIQPHSDLYVAGGRNFVPGMLSTAWQDQHGHGTHVAGTVAARDNSMYVVGVAPGAPVYSLRVLDQNGSGNSSIVVAALDWLTAQVRSEKAAGTYVPTVVNMSLGGPASSAVDYAVRTLVNAGVVVVVAAGNENVDASTKSPARAPEAITVGAYDSYLRKASFSNYGASVDINAPGVSIASTYNNGGAATMSGTSMAAPHVAGAAALYLSKSVNRYRTPQQVRDRLVLDARANVTGFPVGTTNRSLYVGGKAGYPATNIY